MNPVDLIIKKREGGILSPSEYLAFTQGVCDGSWPDYQISAMLMALFIRGLNARETADLTLAMAASGTRFDLSSIPGIKVDKHSTGGVADTTTLILAPLVAACGAPVIKMSGRGLGFTGGTIDKLESIPGFRVGLTAEEALERVKKDQVVILAQTDDLAPADKKLYALRDVTGTVESIPLIAASIMSKKIAAGADAIILDVKCGNGAFMRTEAEARALAESMAAIGREVGRRVTAVISRMDQPLGRNIGNTLEVIEAIDTLKGLTDGDLLEVTLVLGARMLIAAGLAADPVDARRQLLRSLQSGAGLARFRALVAGQGGDSRIIDDYALLPQPGSRATLTAGRAGYLAEIDTAGLGRIFVDLGGGRKSKGDTIDYAAGLIVHCRLGDYIQAGQPLVDLQAADAARIRAVLDPLERAFRFADDPPAIEPLIIDII